MEPGSSCFCAAFRLQQPLTKLDRFFWDIIDYEADLKPATDGGRLFQGEDAVRPARLHLQGDSTAAAAPALRQAGSHSSSVSGVSGDAEAPRDGCPLRPLI